MKKKYVSIAVLSFVIFTIGLFVQIKGAIAPTGEAATEAELQNSEKKPAASRTDATQARGRLQSDNLANSPAQARVKTKVGAEKRYYLLSEPNDPLYSSNWALANIQAPVAWEITEDSSDVTIAVLDSGFALSHQDLSGRWYVNAGESGGGKETNGVDDDANGYVDDFRGWDFYAIDNNPQAGSVDPAGDGVSHGTEVAGLAGATSDNSLGTASVARNPVLMPLQVMGDDGSGYSSDIVAAIYYAVDKGADVINMSLGTSGDDENVREAVDYAIENDVVVVAAAGNCGNSTAGPCEDQPAGVVTFPASYDRVLAVGALNSSNQRASFSSYGQRLDIMAPGSGSLISTTWTAGNGTSAYKTTLYGTSYASPIVASSAALIRSIRPDTQVDDVRALLMAPSIKTSAMGSAFYTSLYGHGLVDIGASISIAASLNEVDAESEPAIFFSGATKAEKRFTATESFGSGCAVPAGTYCSVWLRNTTESYDRFLPYGLADVEGEQGTTWNGLDLAAGEWEVRGVQGEAITATAVVIFSK